MLKFLSLFVVLVGLVSADEQLININSQLDEGLAFVNKILTEKGLGLRPLPPSSYDEVQLSNGVQIGLNSIYRIGDATVKVTDTNKRYVVDYNVGFRLFVVAYGSVKYSGDEFSGLYRIRDNTFHMSFTAVNDTQCKLQLDNYQFEKFDRVTLQASLEKYDDQDVSQVFSKYVLPRVNEKISQLRPMVQRVLEDQFCSKPEFMALTNEHVVSHLKHLLGVY